MTTIRNSALMLIVLTACGRTQPAHSDTTAMGMSASQQGSGMMESSMKGGMTGSSMKGGMANEMPAMGGMHSDSVAARAQADLAALTAASPDAAVKLVPAHQAAVEALIADCEQMMGGMKMTPPAKWKTAVADLRKDLAQMRPASATALHAMLPAHSKRVSGMLSMRHDMMKM